MTKQVLRIRSKALRIRQGNLRRLFTSINFDAPSEYEGFVLALKISQNTDHHSRRNESSVFTSAVRLSTVKFSEQIAYQIKAGEGTTPTPPTLFLQQQVPTALSSESLSTP